MLMYIIRRRVSRFISGYIFFLKIPRHNYSIVQDRSIYSLSGGRFYKSLVFERLQAWPISPLPRLRQKASAKRFFNCECPNPMSIRTFSPLAQLLTERTAPELLYLETKFASLMSYGLTVNLFKEILPSRGIPDP